MEVVNLYMRNSTTKVIDGKVVFSKEILKYFESLRNEETSEWINKYFEVLSDENNLICEKYNIHHIKPVFTFKDETHKNRIEAKPLADSLNENKIRLSIYNHILAHYYLWKIFDNWDSRHAIQQMVNGKKMYIENLSEKELKEIAKFEEECSKENQTQEERKLKKRLENKNWNKTHKKEVSEKNRLKYQKHREDILTKSRKYRTENHDEILARGMRKCYDPKENNYCTLNALKARKKRNKEKYKDVKPIECLVKTENQQ